VSNWVLAFSVLRVALIDDTELLGVKTYTLGPKIVLFCASDEELAQESTAIVRRRIARQSEVPVFM